jgi:VanZ like family
MLLRGLALLLALTWMVGIFYLSDQPTLGIPSLFENQDKVMHFGAYALLGVLLLGGMHLPGGVSGFVARLKLRSPPEATVQTAGYSFRQVALATLIASLYGITDEFHQSFVPGRSPDVLDWLADTAGALLATLLLAQLSRSIHRSRALTSRTLG